MIAFTAIGGACALVLLIGGALLFQIVQNKRELANNDDADTSRADFTSPAFEQEEIVEVTKEPSAENDAPKPTLMMESEPSAMQDLSG